MKYETRGPDALGKMDTRSKSTTKKLAYAVSVRRSDGATVSDSEFIKAAEMAVKQAIRREADKAAEKVRSQIDWLRANRSDLYMRFINRKETLDSCLEIIRGEKRLVAAVRSGALK
jgi:hypothetical protein